MKKHEPDMPSPENTGVAPDFENINVADEHLDSLLSPEINREIDLINSGQRPYYNSREEANQSAAQAPIPGFDHIASSVLLTFTNGTVLEIIPRQRIGKIEIGTDPEVLQSLEIESEKKLPQKIVEALLELPGKSKYIIGAKLVYWQSSEKSGAPSSP
ncbi:MAG: hypothetical protein A2946_04110 [Candidatus Liptonbacteria bacterium RIFCSPLOWO2_01_FULL_53_13]|uniref:Uncharacterized protein n=1 Tax=Candidatus Liptonbacteria bacterium RIFCSPLOWO2_01_FULL_53_13 TaxID=1798651 RepID=A0A1G2CMY4_9BACT|nr:MAG: hypothetical protein A2946_04110 [Candidatus Liptonbacteria bacterium RIFCSPLOWO2_01_FULL_53_13]